MTAVSITVVITVAEMMASEEMEGMVALEEMEGMVDLEEMVGMVETMASEGTAVTGKLCQHTRTAQFYDFDGTMRVPRFPFHLTWLSRM